MSERKSKKKSDKKAAGSGQSRSLYHCNSCRRDLSKTIHIKCAECPEFDLCGDCFAAGVELGNHKKTHSYRVVEDLSGELFAEGWGADEELLLLDAIEMYGLGNWEDIEAHVGSKTALECEEHYYATFIDVETYPLPGFPSSHDGRRAPRTKITDRKGVMAAKANLRGFEKACVGEEVGFIPKREDFAIEYEEGAEDFIANLEVVDSDLENEEKLRTKFDLLRSYYRKLSKRMERKKFAIERNMVNFKEFKTLAHLVPKEETTDPGGERRPKKDAKDIYHKFKPFARLMAPKEWDDLLRGLMEERKLFREIDRLQKYRTSGLTSLAEKAEFEKRKVERSAYLKDRARFFEKCLMPRNRRKTRGMEDSQSSASNDIPSDLSLTLESSMGSVGPLPHAPQMPDGLDRMDDALGKEMLRQEERDLCMHLRITPKQYILVKDALVRESFRAGGLKRSDAINMINMDKSKCERIYAFLVTRGWIDSGRPVRTVTHFDGDPMVEEGDLVQTPSTKEYVGQLSAAPSNPTKIVLRRKSLM
eukprot:TRINITY_DN23_c1_g1_i2.p1 TRINITY_DN23_c1_g1~~TRINITY_DN23_c1_g1_i2.p1  ORF type:complete len:533 (-),score=150.44 TRINITY_DN23_c1_g1_i2:1376-2974(-)